MRIYLDTNVLIEAMEKRTPESDAVWRLLEPAPDRGVTCVTSELALAETLVAPFRDGNATLAAMYGYLIEETAALHVAAIERGTLILAAHMRAENRGLKLPDAIHLATAVQEGCTHFLTGDRRIPQSDGVIRVALSSDEVDRLVREVRP